MAADPYAPSCFQTRGDGNAYVPTGRRLSIEDGGALLRASAAPAAAGADQAGATALTAELNAVTGADGTKGVKLPTAEADRSVTVLNDGTSALKVYPATGGQINALGANAAFTLGAGKQATFLGRSATLWKVAASEGVSDVAGVAAGYKIARGVASITGSGTVVTGLATVVAVVASLQDDASVDAYPGVTATIGDQAGAPAAGSVILSVWKPTTGGAAGDPTPIAATAAKSVNWVAIGT